MKKPVVVVFIIFFAICSKAFTQSYLGFKAGAANISFYHYQKNYVGDSKLTPYYSYDISLFYKKEYSKNCFFGVELDNKQIRSDIRIVMHYGIMDNSGLEAFYKFKLLYAHVFHEGNFYTGKKISIVGDAGFYLGFILASRVKGNFWSNGGNKEVVDTNGIVHQMQVTNHSTKDESPAKNVNIVSWGIRLALGFDVPVNDKLAICCRGSYCMGLSNVLQELASTDGMSVYLRDFGLNVGLVYKIKKKK